MYTTVIMEVIIMTEEEMLDILVLQNQKIEALAEALKSQQEEIKELKSKVQLQELLLYGTVIGSWTTL